MVQARPRMANPGNSAAARIALPAQDEDIVALRRMLVAKLTYTVGKDPIVASDRDWFVATALTTRDRIVDRWMPSTRATYLEGRKRVYYLSQEFLIGRLLFDSLSNLGLTELIRAALAELGVDLDRLRNIEPDAALGNGGLGRLAACFMESMATLSIPAYGYGIRYDHGLFRQVIKDGWQQEYPEDWLSFGNPWEFERPEVDYTVGFGGTVESRRGQGGTARHVWHPTEIVQAVAYDTPVVGWRGRHVNTLRLWSARATDPLRLDAFNSGDPIGAHAHRVKAEAISDVLYPSDTTAAGQELRLRQEYFFTSASLQDLVHRHLTQFGTLDNLCEKAAIHLNDTHPAIAVPELMRILIDEHGLSWSAAWALTTGSISYTNHTLLPEALETWPVPLMARLLPRLMQIIYLINGIHLDSLRATQVNHDSLLSSVSLIDEHNGRRVRMGNIAFLGSHKVNGVSALHTDLLRKTVFRDYHALYPDRIVNKTNGITFRRWLFEANPSLTSLLVEAAGEQILNDPMALEAITPFAVDASFRERFAAARRANKLALAAVIADQLSLKVDPDALFDVQIKRIHEYKRQLLNVLETIALYNAIRAQPTRNWAPRVKIFSGKAAASYQQAKLIIKLINDVAKVVNSDPTVRDILKVIFLPNYNVSLAETIIPAADLSEQISTAGMEASGTGNMKLALNGALTIGTMDGSNIEIRERVGSENIFIFGLSADEVEERRRGGIDAVATIAASPMLGEAIDTMTSGVFSSDDRDRFRNLVESIIDSDYFLVTADFDSYYAKQREVSSLWQNPAAWWQASILNTSHVGWFSSDRAVQEYASEIWKLPLGSVG
jgi:starch phosphorylase